MSRPTSLDEVIQRLTDERERSLALVASLSGTFTSIVDAARLTSTDDEHDPEGATIAFERSQAAALLQSTTRRLAEVDEALERVAEGVYGTCERCGRPIDPERLLARPTARMCVVCAAATQAGRTG